MTENNNDFGSNSKIKPYQFEPVRATGYGDREDNSSEPKTTGKFCWALGNNRLVRVHKMYVHA